MSDTPRTDAKLIQVWDNETGEIKTLDMVYASFARVLERELVAERARNAELVKGIKSILPKPPYHPTLEPEWVYLSELVNKGEVPL